MEKSSNCYNCETSNIFAEYSKILEKDAKKQALCLKCMKHLFPLEKLLFLLPQIEVHHVVLQFDPPVEFWPGKEEAKQKLAIYSDTELSVQCPITARGKISVYEGFFCYKSENIIHELFNCFHDSISGDKLVLRNKKIDEDIGFLLGTFLMQEECKISKLDVSHNLLTKQFCNFLFEVIQKKKQLKEIDLKFNLISFPQEIKINNECIRNSIMDKEANYDALLSPFFPNKIASYDNSCALHFLPKLIGLYPSISGEICRIIDFLDSKFLLFPEDLVARFRNYLCSNPNIHSQWVLYRLFLILNKSPLMDSYKKKPQLEISDYNCKSITLYHAPYRLKIGFVFSQDMGLYIPLYLRGRFYFARRNSAEFYVAEVPSREKHLEIVSATPRPLRQESARLLPTQNGGIVSIGYEKNILTVLVYDISKNLWCRCPEVPLGWIDINFSVSITQNDYLKVLSLKREWQLDLFEPEEGWKISTN